MRCFGRQLAATVTAPGLSSPSLDGGSKMSSVDTPGNQQPSDSQGPIRIGLVLDEPIRLAGLASIFDQPAADAHANCFL